MGAGVTTMAKRRGERSYWEQRYADWWDKPYHGMSTASEEFMAREEENIREKLLPMLRPDHRVLDAGCGYGRLVPIICPHVAEYVGVDFSLQAIEAAYASAPDNARFVVGDMAEADDGPYDVIVMAGIASSVHYRPEVLDHLRALLAPDGVIAVLEYGDDRLIRAEGTEEPL